MSPYYVDGRIPLKQGLKPGVHKNSSALKIKVDGRIPLKQGLKLATLGVLGADYSVDGRIPLKQGLKQAAAKEKGMNKAG